jgi:uncharacterized protein
MRNRCSRFETIAEAIRACDFPQVDAVVGILTGGQIPAFLIAFHLGLPCFTLGLNYRASDNTPHHEIPVVTKPLPALPEHMRRLLLVDDVGVSGVTLNAARGLLSDFTVTTCVVKGQADLVLLPGLRGCVHWPW